MKKLILLCLVFSATICSGQIVCLKFDYKTSNSDDFYNPAFLIRVPDSLKMKENLVSYMLNNKPYLLNLINDYNERIYYKHNTGEALVLYDSLLYRDSITHAFKPSTYKGYYELEQMINKLSYNDTLITPTGINGPLLKFGLVKLPCLNTKQGNLMGFYGDCMLFRINEENNIIHIKSLNKCRSNVFYLEW